MAQAMELEEIALCTECTDEVPGEIRRLKKIFCSKCYIHHCNYRFRKRLYELGKPQKGLATTSSSLGASMQSMDSTDTVSSSGRPNFPLENVMVDYDPANEHSIALLYLLRDAVSDSLDEALSTDHPKKLPFPFTFTILFISAGIHENGEINLNKKENVRVKNFERLKSWFKDTKTMPQIGAYFPSVIVTSLEESLTVSKIFTSEFNILDISEQVDTHINFPLNAYMHEQLVTLVEDLRTKTSRIDLLQILRRNLAEAVAVRIGLNKVLVLDDQTNLAIRMFSMMSIGRGAHLADQMTFVTKGDRLTIARPLMDLSGDDLRDYVKCMQLIEVSKPEPDAKKIDNIKLQCEDFIKTLQRDYPATVPTLTKIGAKLEPTVAQSCASSTNVDMKCSSPDPKISMCSLCKNVQDNDDNHSKPLAAKSLCYACSRILQEMKTPRLLLEFLKQ